MSNELRNFLALSYDELEQLNLKAKEQRKNRVAAHKVQEERIKYLTDEKRIKAVTVLFSDLEGRLHMLDYDKKFLINSRDNLTFDGSSIRGFTAQRESDLRLVIDWGAFYCVDTTCRRATSLGYDVKLAGDAHLTRDNEVLRPLSSPGPLPIVPAELLRFSYERLPTTFSLYHP